jgi:hypothetical protein
VHSADPTLLTLPMGHGTHSTRPRLNVPAGHFEHSTAPSDGWTLPGSHSMASPSTQRLPRGHCTQHTDSSMGPASWKSSRTARHGTESQRDRSLCEVAKIEAFYSAQSHLHLTVSSEERTLREVAVRDQLLGSTSGTEEARRAALLLARGPGVAAVAGAHREVSGACTLAAGPERARRAVFGRAPEAPSAEL